MDDENKNFKTLPVTKTYKTTLISISVVAITTCLLLFTMNPSTLTVKNMMAIQQINIPAPAAAKYSDVQPHIVYFLADDLGWNDVGYHGSIFQTPTMDQLASEGVKLERFYMNPVCTPSRAALLSGRYVAHTGLQHNQIFVYQPNGLSLNCTLLPQALREYGYRNYMVGKWHLGFYKQEYTPEKRGFDKFFGIYPGAAHHYTRMDPQYDKYYSLIENGQPYWDNTTYDTHLYVHKATEYIEEHLNKHPEKPMFMYVSFQAIHQPFQVPDHYSDRYQNITQNKQKRILGGMTTAMDEGIRNITNVLKKHGIWENTVTFFSTDNGGYQPFGSSNYPLSGGKDTLFEGGIRGPAFVRGKGIRPGRVSNSLMHITDIYPTVLSLARPHNHLQTENYTLTSSLKEYIKTLDGFNMWGTISEDGPNPRKEALININPHQARWGESLFPDIYDTGIRSAIIYEKWKLVTGFPYKIFAQIYYPPSKYINEKLNRTINVKLFDIFNDPGEKKDLFFKRPDIVEKLLQRLRFHYNNSVEVEFPDFERKYWTPRRLHNVILPWK